MALQRLDAEDGELKEEIKSRVEKRSGVDQRVSEAETTLAAAEQLFAELTTVLADLTAKRSQLEASVRSHRDRLARLDQEIAGVQAEEQKLAQETSGLGDLADCPPLMATAQQGLAQSEAAAQGAEAAHVAARQKLEAARAPLNEADKRVQRLETEARTISKLVNGETKNLWPPIIDGVTVAKGYEKALGAALGDDLDAPVDPSAPMRWTHAGVAEGDPALPEGVEALAAHVEAPAELARRLAQIGIVAKERGAELVSQLKTGQRLVSPEGDVWRWDGFVAAAHAPTGAARRLAERARLVDIENETRAGPRRCIRQASGAGSRRGRTEGRIRRREFGARCMARRAARGRRRARTPRQYRARDQSPCRAQVGADRSPHPPRRRPQRGRMPRMRAPPRRWPNCRRASTPKPSSPPFAPTSTAIAVSPHRCAPKRRRWRARPNWRTAGCRRFWPNAANGRTASRARPRRSPPSKPASPRSRPSAPSSTMRRHCSREKRRALISEIESAESARRVAADALAAAENVMAETDRAAKVSLEALSSARETCARAEERMDGARRRLVDIEREIHDMLEVEPQGVAGLAEIQPGTELPPLSEIEENLEKLRRDRERLGAVNLRAEEELREVEAQHTSLTTERDDLVEAIKRLRQGIQSLNREARERLLTSFETVNDHFKRLFVELFGGGEAALHLIESDDPLEAGLEIIAKPPGKKPQTLSLLSGGEQALTALALIFAVFLTNPSPICVLDEVDAPLDDHNVERFCNLLHEMTASTETRFIIITHNPITMARMNRLFGVTMAERGVSQLVSVDLEDAVKILDQHVA